MTMKALKWRRDHYKGLLAERRGKPFAVVESHDQWRHEWFLTVGIFPTQRAAKHAAALLADALDREERGNG